MLGGVHSNRMPKNLTDCSPLTWERLRKTPHRGRGWICNNTHSAWGEREWVLGFSLSLPRSVTLPSKNKQSWCARQDTGFCPLHRVCQTHTEGGQGPGPEPARETGLQSRSPDAWPWERQHNADYLSSSWTTKGRLLQLRDPLKWQAHSLFARCFDFN